MKLCEALNIKPGLTAVIGSGGKSTLLEVLAEELAPAAVQLVKHIIIDNLTVTLQNRCVFCVIIVFPEFIIGKHSHTEAAAYVDEDATYFTRSNNSNGFAM